MNGAINDSLVIGQNSQGVEIRGSLLRLTRYLAVFEVYNPNLVFAGIRGNGRLQGDHP